MKSFLSPIGWLVVIVTALVVGTIVVFSSTARAADPAGYVLTIDRIIDGDSFIYRTPPGWPGWIKPEARISLIDTPESRKPPAKKICETVLGHRATDFAKTILHPGDVVTLVWDGKTHEKYGRLIGTVVLSDGRDYGALMITAGVARPYDGGSKKAWC